MIFNLDFASNAILSCLFFFFLIIDLYFLIPAAIEQFLFYCRTCNPIGMSTKEAKMEIEIQPDLQKLK